MCRRPVLASEGPQACLPRPRPWAVLEEPTQPPAPPRLRRGFSGPVCSRDQACANALLSHLFLQINIEDLEEGPVVNGERSDCLLTDAVVSGNKRRSHSGSAEAQEDGAVADGATAPEQVPCCLPPAPEFFRSSPRCPRVSWGALTRFA